MLPVLERITTQTRIDLERRKTEHPLHTFRDALQPSQRSLEEALKAPHTGFILECKKASPSRGLLRPDFDPVVLAKTYEAGGADAISVLTDAPFFQGSHAYLREVRNAVSIPVLCKDFVLEPYQVYEARRFGADAILLMLSVLDDDTYRICAHAAADVGIDVLTEVHDADELERALALNARIVGVNNRNLKTLEVDLATTEHLAAQLPRDRVVISESGVFTHADVSRLRPHADGFLIGSSLVLAQDTAAATRAIVYGRFKVCGLTREGDARAAWDCGATYGGLIFAQESPRSISFKKAIFLAQSVPELAWVGVFVNAHLDDIVKRAERLGLAAVQLHGEESSDDIRALRERLPEHCEIWKAHRVREGQDVPTPEALGADRLLLDTFKKGTRGGTGQRFDWSRLEALAEHRDRIILSGGLSPENAREASAHHVFALDFNSGVEDTPGLKSTTRLKALQAALRG